MSLQRVRAVGITAPGNPEVPSVVERLVREPGPVEVRLARGSHNLGVAKKARTLAKINHVSGRDHRLRYEAVFLDVDGTLLWVHPDIEGYVQDLSPYTTNGSLTVEKATGPVYENMRRHIKESSKHRTADDLADFKRRNLERTARELGIVAPSEVLMEVAKRRTSYVPYPESEDVLRRLREMGIKVYVVSNCNVLLVEVLEDLGWMGYFDGVIASGEVGVEKPDPRIFEEALRVSGVGRVRSTWATIPSRT